MRNHTTTQLDDDEVRHLANLARLGLSEEDVGRLRVQLSDILARFEVLQELDTEGVLPTSHCSLAELTMRDDEARPSLPTNEILANAPDRLGELFRVRLVLDDS